MAAVCTSLFLVDRVGRRPILLSGIAMMIVADAVLIVVFGTDSGALLLGFGGVLLFIIGFNFGFGSLVWVFAGESFPSHLRSVGSSVMLTSNLTANAIVAGFFLTMLTIGSAAQAFSQPSGSSQWSHSRWCTGTRPRPKAANSKTSDTSGRTAGAGRRRAQRAPRT